MRRVSVQHVDRLGRRALPVKNRARGGQKEKAQSGFRVTTIRVQSSRR